MLNEMTQPIIKESEEKINSIMPELYNKILKGDLIAFEKELHEVLTELYNNLAFVIISQAAQSKELEEIAKIIGQKKGLGQISKKKVKLQLRTGHMITVLSWYAVRTKSKGCG